MLPHSADVVVIGAGTVGAWCSVFLAEAGAGRVVVLDAGRAGCGCSTRAAGMVRTQGGTPTAVHLGRHSVEFYETQRERYGIDSGFRRQGYLVAVSGPDAVRAARERVAMHHAEGLPSRWVEPDEAASLLPLLDPSRIDGATYADLDGAIDPPRNVTAYVRAMRDTGVALHEHTPAIGLELDGSDGSRRVTGVVTDHGTIATDRVVLAGGIDQPVLGAWAGARVVVGGARHLVAVTSPHKSIGDDMVMGFDLAAGLYWREEEGGILFGASNPVEVPGEARSIDWAHLEASRRRLGELVPLTRELDLRRLWAATIDFTPDHLPIIGPARGPDGDAVAGVTVASAGGHGMMWGPAVSRCAADLALTGATTVTDVSDLGVDRFDAHGRSRLATDPVALPFPEQASEPVAAP